MLPSMLSVKGNNSDTSQFALLLIPNVLSIFVADILELILWFVWRKEDLAFHVNHLPSRWFTWNAKSYSHNISSLIYIIYQDVLSLKNNNKKKHFKESFLVDVVQTLTLKAPRKTASENVVCLCRLLNILADFSNLFLHTGKQCGPRSDCS